MTFALRTLAGILLVFATIAAVADLTRYAQGQPLQMTSIYAHWLAVAPQSLKSVAQFVQRYTHPYFWDPVIVRLLVLPTWFVLAALGVVAGILGRRRRRVAIYSN